MKLLVSLSFFILGTVHAHALVISEVLSNPTGTDNGREWVELYNNATDPIDISSFSLSVEQTGNAVSLTPLQGGTILAPGQYAIIATIVSGQTKFLEDYPSYGGIVLRVSSSFSLTNGSASLYVRQGVDVQASVPSYTASKEGTTLSLVQGNYVTGATPTPGVENSAPEGEEQAAETTTATTTNTQVSVSQMSPPTSDIVIYMPSDKVVVAGAESEFSVFSMTRAGKSIHDLRYTWAFGDGGQATGSTTRYRYGYSGRYIAQVEATNSTTVGSGRMVVRVVPPDISVIAFGSGKYGSYVDIRNQNEYDIDLSNWILSIDGSGHLFPKNTLLAKGVTRFSGIAMGFASTTMSTTTMVRILFPNLEEVVRHTQAASVESVPVVATSTQPVMVRAVTPVRRIARVQPKPQVLGIATTSMPKQIIATTTRAVAKDTRIVRWFRVLFAGE